MKETAFYETAVQVLVILLLVLVVEVRFFERPSSVRWRFVYATVVANGMAAVLVSLLTLWFDKSRGWTAAYVWSAVVLELLLIVNLFMSYNLLTGERQGGLFARDSKN